LILSLLPSAPPRRRISGSWSGAANREKPGFEHRASSRQTSSAVGVSRGAAKLAFHFAEFAFISQRCLAQALGSRYSTRDPDFGLPFMNVTHNLALILFKFEHRVRLWKTTRSNQRPVKICARSNVRAGDR
jgi:hypothetical protein